MFDTVEDDFEDFEPELPDAPAELAHTSLADLYKNLNRLFDGENWVDYEPETISLHLGVKLDDLTLDKIEVLRNIVTDESVLNDATFVLHAVDSVNGIVANFDHLPQPTSLELGYFIASLQDLFKARSQSFVPTHAIKHITWYILNEEGYSEPVPPFVYLDEDLPLAKGQTAVDTNAKKEAVQKYIDHMRNV